jgi:pseudouridine-5'-phosphate glycosidase/pseudouridine kinase
MQGLKKEGLDTSSIVVKTADPKDSLENIRTAQYVSINDQKKDLVLAMADMSIFSNFTFKKKTIAEMKPSLKWVVIDGNWDSPVTRHLMKNFKSENTKVAFEPVSIAKAASIFESARALHKEKENKLTVFPDHKVDLATPNQHELAAMYRSARKHEFFQDQDWWNVIDSLGIPSYGARDRFVNLTSRKMTDQGIPLQTVQLLPFIPTILTKLGPEGVLMTQLLKPGDPRLTNPDSAPWILSRCTNGNTKVGGVYMRLFPAIEQVKDEDVVSVNGVGDTFLGVLVAGLAKGAILGENLINIAQKGAVMTLKSKEAVSPALGHLASELNELAGLTKN